MDFSLRPQVPLLLDAFWYVLDWMGRLSLHLDRTSPQVLFVSEVFLIIISKLAAWILSEIFPTLHIERKARQSDPGFKHSKGKVQLSK